MQISLELIGHPQTFTSVKVKYFSSTSIITKDSKALLNLPIYNHNNKLLTVSDNTDFVFIVKICLPCFLSC